MRAPVAFAVFAFGLGSAGLACEPFTGATGGAGSSSSSDASTGSMETSSSTGMDCTVTGCAAGANATGECKNGACVYTCVGAFGDCDADPTDCEADLTVDGNCGACAVDCSKACVAVGDSHGCTDVVELAAGDWHSCARTGDGRVYCWGRNNQGQLGLGGGTGETSTPAKVDLSFAATQISARGNATCAVSGTGQLACWGNDGSTTTKPLDYVGAPAKISRVAVAGEKFPDPGMNTFGKTLLLLPGGDVRGTIVSNVTEPMVTGVKAGQQGMAAGGLHACVFDATQKVFCLGDDSLGQLGQGTPNHPSTIVQVQTAEAVDLAAGYAFTCAVDMGGRVSCWGDNALHQVSSSSTVLLATPQKQPNLIGVDAIAAGWATAAAIVDGTLYAWGDNQFTQGNPSADATLLEPTAYPGLAGVKQAALGMGHTCVLLDGAIVKCWGQNAFGQVGMSKATDPVLAPSTVAVP